MAGPLLPAAIAAALRAAQMGKRFMASAPNQEKAVTTIPKSIGHLQASDKLRWLEVGKKFLHNMKRVQDVKSVYNRVPQRILRGRDKLMAEKELIDGLTELLRQGRSEVDPEELANSVENLQNTARHLREDIEHRDLRLQDFAAKYRDQGREAVADLGEILAKGVDTEPPPERDMSWLDDLPESTKELWLEVNQILRDDAGLTPGKRDYEKDFLPDDLRHKLINDLVDIYLGKNERPYTNSSQSGTNQ